MPPRKRQAIGQVQSKARKMKQQRRQETPEEKNIRLALMREKAATSRASETVQQREARLQVMKERAATSRASETVQQREARLQEMRDRARQSRTAQHFSLALEGFRYDPHKDYTQHASVTIGKMEMGRTTKALKFANPGRHTGYPPEAANKREKRKLQTKNTSVNSDRQLIAAKSKVYDGQGFLLYSGIDLCDCLDEDCLGCFYACSKCGSRKCGPECRCDRKWLYEQIEIEGGEIIRNKHVI
ncbi:ARL14 effector protein isoform X2 [Ahaetulla prasina]|uniref:ARL14 effector protein isoform X2 n=1 Tax=Ahaetulla prasina TaxID=499056 RepID=UPI002649F894|nr:ARL14 effector protein isoform X2 [Ahaetulla prasina]